MKKRLSNPSNNFWEKNPLKNAKGKLKNLISSNFNKMVVFYECFFIELIEILKNLLMDKIRVFVKIEYRHYESDTDTLIERRFGF